MYFIQANKLCNVYATSTINLQEMCEKNKQSLWFNLFINLNLNTWLQNSFKAIAWKKKNTSPKGAIVKVVASVLWKKKNKKSCLLTRLCWICSALCQCDKCSIRGDSTVVVLHRHEDVAVVAPVGGPWVLNQPVRLSIQDAVSHGEHCVVQVIRGVTCQSQPRG